MLNELILLLILAIRGNSCSQVYWLLKTGAQNSMFFYLSICIQAKGGNPWLHRQPQLWGSEHPDVVSSALAPLLGPRALPCCRGWEVKLSIGHVTPSLLWPGVQLPLSAAIRPLTGGHSQAMDFDTGLPSHTCHSGMTQHIFCMGLVVFYG